MESILKHNVPIGFVLKLHTDIVHVFVLFHYQRQDGNDFNLINFSDSIEASNLIRVDPFVT